MSKKNFLAILLAAPALMVHAQTTDTITTGTLDEVVVTANKFPQKQSTTGKVVTVINKDQIEKSSGKTLSQLLTEQAGVVVNGALNTPGSVQTLYMRGANVGRTLILIDGIPMNDPSTITNDFDLNFLSLNDVERIEISKGAQSSLYGSDAIAGAINIITTKKDINKPLHLKGTMAFGNLNTSRSNVQAYGKVKKLTYTARFAKLRTDGFSSAYDSTGTNNFDKDGYTGDVAGATLQYQVSDRFAVKTHGMFTQYRADIDAAGFTDTRNYFIKNKNLVTGAGAVYKNNAVTVNGNYQYNRLRRHYNNNAALPGAAVFSTDDFNGSSHFAELFASIRLHDRFTLVAGTDYRHNAMDGGYHSSVFGSGTYPDTAMQQVSAFGSVIYNALQLRLNIEVGGRLNNHSHYGNNATYTFNPSYAFSDQVRMFGSIATGFKTPGLYQLYDAYSGNLQLKPEVSKNYEVGVQHQYKKLDHRLVYFYREIKNGIDYNYISFRYFNFIRQVVSGLEYEVKVKPVDAVQVTANYTYLNGTEHTQSRIDFKDTTYQYLLRRPAHTANLTIGYQVLKPLYISISGRFVSNRNDVGGFMAADVGLKSYTLVNAYAEYILGEQMKIFVDAQNLTNTRFFDIRGYNTIPLFLNGGITFQW